MIQSQDFKELLSILEKYKVRYLIIGGYAVMLYSEPRWTKDLDIWIALDEENSEAVFSALKEFGAPLAGLNAADFQSSGYFYQMGNPPMRIDIMMDIPGGDFQSAWGRKNTLMVGGNELHFISKEDLIKVKLASGREQDLKDIDSMQKNSDESA